jgi:glycogen operon protein
VLDAPDWSQHSHSLAFTLRTLRGTFMLHGMLNAYWEPLAFSLPRVPEVQERWRRCLDTALESPADLLPWHEAPDVDGSSYVVQPRSMAMMARALPTAG